MPQFFSTLSKADEVCTDSLQTFLDKHGSKYFMVHEQGQHGTNHHIHFYIHTESYSATDTLTRALREKCYPTDFIKKLDTTRKLVLTRKVNSIEKSLVYMVKEQNSYKNLKYFNFDKKYIDKIFKKSGLEKVTQCRNILTLMQAPYILAPLMDLHLPHCLGTTEHHLSKLVADNYIVHHLFDENSLTKITKGLQALQSYYPEIFSQ